MGVSSDFLSSLTASTIFLSTFSATFSSLGSFSVTAGVATDSFFVALEPFFLVVSAAFISGFSSPFSSLTGTAVCSLIYSTALRRISFSFSESSLVIEFILV